MSQPVTTDTAADDHRSDDPLTDYVLQLSWSVPEDRIGSFDEWYSEEHLADMVGVPGIVLGQRYRRDGSYPFASASTFDHLTLYAVTSPEVFDAAEYRSLATSPSERTRRVVDGLGMARTFYRQRFPASGLQSGPGRGRPGALLHIMTGCEPGVEADFNRWYDQEHLPAVVGVPGVISGRRLEVAPGSQPGAGVVRELRYLALYELEDAAVAASAALMAASRPTPWRTQIGDQMEAHVQVYLPIARMAG